MYNVVNGFWRLKVVMNRQLSWDLYFLGLAKNASLRSKDPSTKTGAVIVRPDNSICSVGYNGFPRKLNDDPALYADRKTKLSRIIHSEMNALLFSREPLIGYTLYTWPFMSCDRCFVHMVQAGITRFVYPKATPSQLERWGESFNLTLCYAKEADVEMVEINIE